MVWKPRKCSSAQHTQKIVESILFVFFQNRFFLFPCLYLKFTILWFFVNNLSDLIQYESGSLSVFYKMILLPISSVVLQDDLKVTLSILSLFA